jgi:hypothetical protein
MPMHIGLMMECDYRAGKTQEEAFHEAFSIRLFGQEVAPQLGY